jgi:hypothetical protein
MQILFQRGFSAYTFNSEGNFESGETYSVYLTGSLNWGLAPLHRITQRGPFQDGDSDIDFRLDPRVFSLPIVVPASTIEEHLDRRNLLLQVFKPGNDTATFQLSWTSGIVTKERSINVKVVGGLAMDTDSKDFDVRAVVQLRAADPTWYDTTENNQAISQAVFGSPTPYPKPYPVPYGSISINRITTINYDGSWIAFPTIQCTGPATDLTLVDSLGNIISFDVPIPAANTWTINLSYGVKTVTDQLGNSQFAALNINSDLQNWALYPDPTALNGANTFSVSANTTDANTRVVLTYYSRYIGV